MKAKEWLLANGHIKEITRGRMSRDNIALIEAAVRDGANIDGYAVSKAQPKTEEEKSSPRVERVASGDRIADVPDEVRPEKNWQAHAFVGTVKHTVGMRTACNTCHNSLTYCHCATPLVTIDGDLGRMVKFTVRTTPLPNRPW